MAKRTSNKPIEQLSAQELYELAKLREQEEAEAQREENRARQDELRDRRRELTAQYKKDIAALDRELRALGGRPRGRAAGRGRGGSLTDKVLELVARAGTISTKELKVALEKEGMDTTNMGQTLAYLKRNGKVIAPSRATYAVAE